MFSNRIRFIIGGLLVTYGAVFFSVSALAGLVYLALIATLALTGKLLWRWHARRAQA